MKEKRANTMRRFLTAAALIAVAVVGVLVTGHGDWLTYDVVLHFNITELVWTLIAARGTRTAWRNWAEAKRDRELARKKVDGSPVALARLIYTTAISTRNGLRVTVFAYWGVLGLVYGLVASDSPLLGIPRLAAGLGFFFMAWEMFFAADSEDEVREQLDQLIDDLAPGEAQ